MHYRSLEDLSRHVLAWSSSLPRDVELVVGVPRSGMLPASMLALHRNVPLLDLDGFLAGRAPWGGERLADAPLASWLDRPREVLVVDDSVRTGLEMRRTRERIAAAATPHRVRYAAPFVTREGAAAVDVWAEVVPSPRVFEWNLLHHSMVEHFCVDIDGVLARDPAPGVDDDGPRYERFLLEAELLHRPTVPVGWLVTCRLERYRAQTEDWLGRHGIAYRELVMMDHATAAERRAAGRHAAHKAEVYTSTRAYWFLESSHRQAVEIARLSGKDVFCVDTRENIVPGTVPVLGRVVREGPGALVRRARRRVGALRR